MSPERKKKAGKARAKLNMNYTAPTADNRYILLLAVGVWHLFGARARSCRNLRL